MSGDRLASLILLDLPGRLLPTIGAGGFGTGDAMQMVGKYRTFVDEGVAEAAPTAEFPYVPILRRRRR